MKVLKDSDKAAIAKALQNAELEGRFIGVVVHAKFNAEREFRWAKVLTTVGDKTTSVIIHSSNLIPQSEKGSQFLSCEWFEKNYYNAKNLTPYPLVEFSITRHEGKSSGINAILIAPDSAFGTIISGMKQTLPTATALSFDDIAELLLGEMLDGTKEPTMGDVHEYIAKTLGGKVICTVDIGINTFFIFEDDVPAPKAPPTKVAKTEKTIEPVAPATTSEAPVRTRRRPRG